MNGGQIKLSFSHPSKQRDTLIGEPKRVFPCVLDEWTDFPVSIRCWEIVSSFKALKSYDSLCCECSVSHACTIP